MMLIVIGFGLMGFSLWTKHWINSRDRLRNDATGGQLPPHLHRSGERTSASCRQCVDLVSGWTYYDNRSVVINHRGPHPDVAGPVFNSDADVRKPLPGVVDYDGYPG